MSSVVSTILTHIFQRLRAHAFQLGFHPKSVHLLLMGDSVWLLVTSNQFLISCIQKRILKSSSSLLSNSSKTAWIPEKKERLRIYYQGQLMVVFLGSTNQNLGKRAGGIINSKITQIFEGIEWQLFSCTTHSYHNHYEVFLVIFSPYIKRSL